MFTSQARFAEDKKLLGPLGDFAALFDRLFLRLPNPTATPLPARNHSDATTTNSMATGPRV